MSKSVLIVDDSQSMRYQLKSILTDKNDNLKVYEAGSVKEAKNWLSWLTPDFITIDLDLNGQSGFDVVDCYQHKLDLDKVVVVTASESLMVLDSCIERGVKYLPKGNYLSDKETFGLRLSEWMNKVV
jgi:DNA-binding NtrC family response regulator